MNEFEKVEIIDNIDKAVAILKNHEILFSNKTYFIEKKGKVLVIGLNSKFYLTYEQFKDLYVNHQFVVFEEKDENFDFSRDDEYYSWRHK